MEEDFVDLIASMFFYLYLSILILVQDMYYASDYQVDLVAYYIQVIHSYLHVNLRIKGLSSVINDMNLLSMHYIYVDGRFRHSLEERQVSVDSHRDCRETVPFDVSTSCILSYLLDRSSS